MAEDNLVPEVEPTHLKQVSNANEVAAEFNEFIKEQDFGLLEIEEDMNEGEQNSIIMDHIEKKLGSKKKWNAQKRSTIHKQLQNYVELTRNESDPNANSNTNGQSRSSYKPARESNVVLLDKIINIAQLKDRTDSNNNSNNQKATQYDTYTNYKDIRFRDYHFKHLAQFIEDHTQQEFIEDGNSCDLYKIVYENRINGTILLSNLNESYIKQTFNQNIKDGKHKFKKITIKYIMDQYQNDVIKNEWTCQDVFRFLYFAESQVVKQAIIDLQIDGKVFLSIDQPEFARRLGTCGIKLGPANNWHTKIVKYLS